MSLILNKNFKLFQKTVSSSVKTRMIKTIILYVKKVLIENQKHLKKRQKNDYLKNKNVRKNEYISIIIAPKIISQK